MPVAAPASPLAPSPAPSPASAASAPSSSKSRQAAEQSAREFEAVFLGQMTQLMLESVEVGDQFSGGHGEEVFRGVLAEKLGTEIARTGGVGLAPAVMEQIIKMQGDSGHGQ